MAGSVTNTGAREYKADFGSLYPCSFTFNVELNEYTENHEQKIDMVCKSQPVRGAEETNAINILCESISTLGEEATHAIESVFSYVVEDTEQTSDDTKALKRWRTPKFVDKDGAPFVIEKMYCRNSDTYKVSYKEYELVFKYTFSKDPDSPEFYGNNPVRFEEGKYLDKGCSICMFNIVYDVIKDNPERFGISRGMALLSISSNVCTYLVLNIVDYDNLNRSDRETIFYYSKEIGDFKICMQDYDYNQETIEFSTEPVPEGEEIKRLIRSKFPYRKPSVGDPSSQYNYALYYTGEHMVSPAIIMQDYQQDGTRGYSVHMGIKCNIVTGILDIGAFENIARALGAKFAYAVSYAFCKKVRNEVSEYNRDIDEHNAKLDENVTKLDKISVDFPRLRQRTRGAIKWGLPPKSLQEAATRVLATDQYDYSADTEENEQIIPVHLRSYIGNLRSDHMEYVLPRQAT